MDPLVIVLRLIHVVAGVIWVGMVTFATYYLQPAVQEVGPDGGKVMAAIQRRGMMTVMPVLALATLLSGLWLYLRAAGGAHGAFARSGQGMAFGLGGLAAIAAFVLGMFVLRPAMMRAMTVTGQEAQRLRARAAATSKAVTHLLFFAVAAMAVARYLV